MNGSWRGVGKWIRLFNLEEVMEFDARIPVQSFLDYLKFEKRYSAHTIRSYQDDLVAFLILSSWSLGGWVWGR